MVPVKAKFYLNLDWGSDCFSTCYLHAFHLQHDNVTDRFDMV